MESTGTRIEILTSTAPAKWKLTFYRCFIFLLGPIARFLLGRNFSSIEVVGKENLRGGPYLVLMNHSCALDPLLLTFFGEQPLQFLISESFMRRRPASRFISLFGHVAKRKLDFDPGSLQLIKRWIDCGASVALFPEGVFSIFSEPSPLMPGLEQLVRFLNLPVVIVHLSNGDRVKPLWAKAQRKTKIKITIHPAHAFTKTDAVLPVITQKIFSVDGALDVYPSDSKQLALGLSKALHICPTCDRPDGLTDNGNQLVCTQCKDSWQINGDNSVTHPRDHKVKDLFIKSFQKTVSVWCDKKVVQSQHPVIVYDISKAGWVKHEQGHLIFNDTAVSIDSLSIPYSDIQAHTQDWGEVIILKTKAKRWAIEIPHDSRAHFVNLLDYILTKRTGYA